MKPQGEAAAAVRILGRHLPREARDLIFKIRSCTVRSDLKNKAFSAVFCLFLRSDLTVQDRILKIRSLASLGGGGMDWWRMEWPFSTFCASFFPSFFPLPTVPFLPESPPLPRTSKLLRFLEEMQYSGAGVRRGFWRGSPHRKKKEFP